MDARAWIALVSAGIVGYAAFPHRHALFWRRWVPGVAIRGLAGLYVLQALPGLVGRYLADVLNWVPTGGAWGDGILYGLAASSLLRLIPVPSFGLGEGPRFLSALGLLITHFVDWLDARTLEVIDQKLAGLSNDDMERLVMNIEHRMAKRATHVQYMEFTRGVRGAVADLRSSDSRKNRRAHDYLQRVAYDWYLEYKEYLWV